MPVTWEGSCPPRAESKASGPVRLTGPRFSLILPSVSGRCSHGTGDLIPGHPDGGTDEGCRQGSRSIPELMGGWLDPREDGAGMAAVDCTPGWSLGG